MEEQHESHTLRDLTDAQRLAISILVTGAGDRAAAEAAGKTRETVNRWTHHHPEFRAELNRQRQQLQDQHADQCRVMNGLALDHLYERMLDNDPEAIKTWLKISGLGKLNTAVTDHLDSEDIIAERVKRRFQQVEDESVDPYSKAFNNQVVNGGPSPADIRKEVEQDLRALTDCELAPADLESGEVTYPTADLEADEPDVA